MNPAIERLRNEARLLPLDERETILIALDYDIRGDKPSSTDLGTVAVWDEEIASRMKEVEEGKVPLLSSEEFERDTDQLFAGLGIQRTPRSHDTSHTHTHPML